MKKKQKHRSTEQIIAEEKLKKLFNISKDYVPIDFVGKSVKLQQEDYDRRILNKELSKPFVDWYKKNKDKTFIAKKATNTKLKNMYEFEGVDTWMFHAYALMEV